MKVSRIQVFGIVTALLVAYVFWDFRSEKKQTAIKEQESLLLKGNKEMVNQFELQSGDENPKSLLRLVRSTEGWKFEIPFSEPADNSIAQDFIDGIAEEKSSQTVAEGDEIDWKIYGLDAPKGRIVLGNNAGEKTLYTIGTKKSFQGDAFLRRDQEKKVYLVAGTWFSKLEKDAFQFRDKRLVLAPMVKVRSMTYKSNTGQFDLGYADAKWTLKGKTGWNLDQNKIREFLAVLSGNIVTEFMKEGESAEKEMKSFGLVSPLTKITLGLDEGAKLELLVGEDKNKNYFVWHPERKAIVKITAADASKLNQLRADTLRDRKEPFQFEKSKVAGIELKTVNGRAVFKKDNEAWIYADADSKDKKLESSQLDGLLVKLETTEAAEFIEKKMELPLERESILLKDVDGKTLFELRFGESQKKKINGLEKTVILAKTSAFGELISLDEATYHGLDLKSFVIPADGGAK